MPDDSSLDRMSSSARPSNEAEQGCPISKLSEAELSEIFKRLPPYERLLVSEVSRRWHGISRKPWLDVTALDLSLIPGSHIRAIIKQCPNLVSVFAQRKKCFGLNELSTLHQSARLSCVKLYHCDFAVVKQGTNVDQDAFPCIFSENLQHAAWNELVLHDEWVHEKKLVMCGNSLKTISVYDERVKSWWRFRAEQLPASLTRLQLSGSRLPLIPAGLSRLQNLECLILHCSWLDNSCPGHRDIATLRNLRELCIGHTTSFPLWFSVDLKLLTANLPQLEVLFAIGKHGTAIGQLADLVTERSALRILVLAGMCIFHEPIEIPPRKLYPDGFGSDPLPLLHVFVSCRVLQKLHFAPSDAALVYPRDASMHEFLKREDIAPIFKGVWIAEKIKELASYGLKLEINSDEFSMSSF